MLSIAVGKVSVTTSQQGLYYITLRLTLTDTEGAGFVKDYSGEYRTGEDIATKKAKFIKEMQRDINYYKAGKALSNTIGLTAAISEIQSGLTT